MLSSSYVFWGTLIEALRERCVGRDTVGELGESPIGVWGETAGSGSSNGLALVGGVGTKLPYSMADPAGSGDCLCFGIAIGGVFFNFLLWSPDDSSDSGRDSPDWELIPNGAGDSRKGSTGSSPGPSACPSVEHGLARGVKGDVAPYVL